MATYIPLRLANQMNIRSFPYKNVWTRTIEQLSLEIDDALEFLWFNTDLLDPEYTGKYRDINDLLLRSRSDMYKIMTGNSKIPKNPEKDRSLSAELFSSWLIPSKWSENKQVYKFDAELELSLADSEEIHLPVRILDRIPYYTFYLEFAEDGIFKDNFHGAFIHVVRKDTGYLVYIERVKEDGRVMFGTLPLVAENNENATFLFRKEQFSCDDTDRNADWKEFGFFIINALLYLCADNAEVQESEVTKSTYKPRKEIKNKFSEIRQWECGYRYGASIRKKKVNHKKSERNQDEQTEFHMKIKRALPAHTRRAHWHHYWIGPRSGERKLILHWIAPVFVSGTESGVAVVHRVDKKGFGCVANVFDT